MQQQQQLLVCGFVRCNHDKPVPSDVTTVIYQFYLNVLDSTILCAAECMQLLDLLYSELTKRKQGQARISSLDTELLFRASEHNFNSEKFHSFCDGKGATITLIHTEFDHVFGGYTTESWDKHQTTITDPTAFLFNAKPCTKVHPLHELETDGDEALWNYTGYGPIYGSGNDVWISDAEGCKIRRRNGAKPGTYSFDQKELTGATELDEYGRALFVVKDYEVFSISMTVH